MDGEHAFQALHAGHADLFGRARRWRPLLGARTAPAAGREAMNVFIEDVARGAFTYAPPTLDQLLRAMEIDQRYSDLRLGLVDWSTVALADVVGIRRLATRDIRDFAPIRLRDGSFELAVHPTHPDRP